MAEATPTKVEEKKKKKLPKGRHASQIKRQRQDIKRRVRNAETRSRLRTAVKKVRVAIAAKDKGAAQQTLRQAISLLHKGAKSNLIHHRNASRHIARLSQLVSRLAA